VIALFLEFVDQRVRYIHYQRDEVAAAAKEDSGDGT